MFTGMLFVYVWEYPVKLPMYEVTLSAAQFSAVPVRHTCEFIVIVPEIPLPGDIISLIEPLHKVALPEGTLEGMHCSVVIP